VIITKLSSKPILYRSPDGDCSRLRGAGYHIRSKRLIEQFLVSEFLDSCSVKVADLEAAWARKNSVPVAQVQTQFSRFMDGVVHTKRTAPSLRQNSYQSNEHRKS